MITWLRLYEKTCQGATKLSGKHNIKQIQDVANSYKNCPEANLNTESSIDVTKKKNTLTGVKANSIGFNK